MKTLFFVGVCGILMTISPIMVLADTASSSGVVEIKNPLKVGSITELLGVIGGMLQAAAIVVGVIMIIIAGIQYMTSAGSEEKAKKARQTILYTLIGVAIVTAANFIVQLVSEILGKVK